MMDGHEGGVTEQEKAEVDRLTISTTACVFDDVSLWYKSYVNHCFVPLLVVCGLVFVSHNIQPFLAYPFLTSIVFHYN